MTVRSYRALVRIVGYFMYNGDGHVLLRGQTECYGNLKPSAYRLSNPKHEIDTEVASFVEAIRQKGFVDRFTDNNAHESTEPLLQHYGIRTRWVDVVDSVPHALFFALNALVPSPFAKDKSTYVPSTAKWGYITVIDTGRWRESTAKGLWTTTKGLRVCDLRAAKPSTALRPHAQHGLLLSSGETDSQEPDLWSHVVANIRLQVSDGRTWIGGHALQRESFFPRPTWDLVYQILTGKVATTFIHTYRWKAADLGSITTFDFHDE